MAKCTTRHIQANYSWVYQAAQQSQYTNGFIRLPNQANIQLGLSGCHPSQSTFGFIRTLRKWKGRMAKLVAHSRTRDTSTRSIWLGIHNTYTPNTRKYPLLCSTVPWAMHSFPVLFRVCIGYLLATLIFLWVFTMHYVYQGHSSSLPLLSHSYSSDPNQGSHHNKPQGDTTT